MQRGRLKIRKTGFQTASFFNDRRGLEREFQAAVVGAAGFVVALRAAVVVAAVEPFVEQVVDAEAGVEVFVEAVARTDADQSVGADGFSVSCQFRLLLMVYLGITDSGLPVSLLMDLRI